MDNAVFLVILAFVGVTIAPIIPFAALDAIWEFRQYLKEREKK